MIGQSKIKDTENTIGAMKGYEADGGECRAVFWFDN